MMVYGVELRQFLYELDRTFSTSTGASPLKSTKSSWVYSTSPLAEYTAPAKATAHEPIFANRVFDCREVLKLVS